MDAQTRSILHGILRRESVSLLSYVAGAYPWATQRQTEALTALQKVIAEQKEAVAELGRYLARRKEPFLFFGSYPTAYTTLNFISLEHLLPRLVEQERANLANLEKDVREL